MTDNDIYYDEAMSELRKLIPKEEMQKINHNLSELDSNFLGFVDVYYSLSKIIGKGSIIIDFGCYMGAQQYFFKDHKQYIGVDCFEKDRIDVSSVDGDYNIEFSDLKRFSSPNAIHVSCTIKEFIERYKDALFKANEPWKYFAICSYVPAFEETKLVRETFPNVMCIYPSGGGTKVNKELFNIEDRLE